MNEWKGLLINFCLWYLFEYYAYLWLICSNVCLYLFFWSEEFLQPLCEALIGGNLFQKCWLEFIKYIFWRINFEFVHGCFHPLCKLIFDKTLLSFIWIYLEWIKSLYKDIFFTTAVFNVDILYFPLLFSLLLFACLLLELLTGFRYCCWFFIIYWFLYILSL